MMSCENWEQLDSILSPKRFHQMTVQQVLFWQMHLYRPYLALIGAVEKVFVIVFIKWRSFHPGSSILANALLHLALGAVEKVFVIFFEFLPFDYLDLVEWNATSCQLYLLLLVTAAGLRRWWALPHWSNDLQWHQRLSSAWHGVTRCGLPWAQHKGPAEKLWRWLWWIWSVPRK